MHTLLDRRKVPEILKVWILIHAGEVTCFDFGGGGTFVMSGDAGGGLRLWRTSDGVPLCARSGAHAGAVTCLASLDPHQVRAFHFVSPTRPICTDLLTLAIRQVAP